MQEVFITLDRGAESPVDQALASVHDLGGQVRHIYAPIVMVGRVPAEAVYDLSGHPGIASVDTGAHEPRAIAEADDELGMAMAAWNDHVSAERLATLIERPELNASWADHARQPPDPPPHIREQLLLREREMAPQAAEGESMAGAPNLSIPVLTGRIAVGIVWVDSTVNIYQITNDEKTKTLNQATEGLDMLAAFEPRANIQWVYDFKRPKISLAANQFTEANKNSWEDLWRNAALSAMGYSADLNGMNAYINAIKASNGAQWAYVVFITKYPKTWFAYEWGNHIVMDFTVDGWGIDNFHLVIAHETGHVFGCPDEYTSSGCNCTSLFGRYQIANGNCESCAAPFVPCLMSHNTAAVCDYTRGHLGWNELAVQSEGTTTLKGTWTFDFDTGTQGPATGADIWWEQVDNTIRFLVPQSGATLVRLGTPNFDAVSVETLKAAAYTSTPINGSNNSANKLTAGTVVAAKTNAGRYAKMKIESYGYNLGIRWVTYK